MKTTALKLSSIRLDPALQTRAEMRTEVIEDYSSQMRDGAKFPPVVVFRDGAEWLLADGWHRYRAAEAAGLDSIQAEQHEGGREAATLHAIKANQSHGLRRSNEDKRRCVQTALSAFPSRSSRDIAELCGVSDPFVGGIRGALQTVSNAPTTRTTKDGRQYPAKRPTKPTKPVDPDVDPWRAQGRPITDEEAAEASRKAFAEKCGKSMFSEPGKMEAGAPKEPELDSSSVATSAGTGLGSTGSSSTDGLSATDAEPHAKPAAYIPANGFTFAKMAISQLERIQPSDIQRLEAFELVEQWIKNHKEL